MYPYTRRELQLSPFIKDLPFAIDRNRYKIQNTKNNDPDKIQRTSHHGVSSPNLYL